MNKFGKEKRGNKGAFQQTLKRKKYISKIKIRKECLKLVFNSIKVCLKGMAAKDGNDMMKIKFWGLNESVVLPQATDKIGADIILFFDILFCSVNSFHFAVFSFHDIFSFSIKY